MENTETQDRPATTEGTEDSGERQLSRRERRHQEFLRRSRERSGYEHEWYIEMRSRKTPLRFETTGGDIVGLMGFFRVYEFDVKVRRIKDPLVLKKLDTFTISALKDQKFLRQHIKNHQPTRDKKLKPKPGAGYNPPLPEGLVETAKAEKKKLACMMLNGTIIIGVPVEESLYSILVKVPDLRGCEVLVYKHGLAGAKLLEDIPGL